MDSEKRLPQTKRMLRDGNDLIVGLGSVILSHISCIVTQKWEIHFPAASRFSKNFPLIPSDASLPIVRVITTR